MTETTIFKQAIAAVLILLVGCARGPVTLDHEPSHHLALANDYLRVYRVEAGAHKSTRLHVHDHDYVWVAVGAADITNAPEGKPPLREQVEDGSVHFAAGNFAHVVTNNADRPFRNYTIALLRHGSVQLAPGEAERGLTLLESGSVESLLVKDGVRASEIVLKPGATVSGPHLRRPHLLIDLEPDDGRLLWAAQGESDHLENQSDRERRYLLLEF
ncbi:MAG: hypothetical protein JO041_00980 [Acidobacteria bacterium]|nr:hypothetical protein [Acidobacteriota bacterium]